MEEIKLASVKFKSAGKIYYFSTNLKLKKDDRVVVETARGLELGEISQELKDISEFNLDTELKKPARPAPPPAPAPPRPAPAPPPPPLHPPPPMPLLHSPK